MYLEMFGFDEKPFHITPNPRFIFLSKNHKEAFAHLLYGIQQRVGFLSLAGEVGTGKTTVLRTLLGQLAESEYRVALIFNPCLTSLELLQTIHREFAIEVDLERSHLIDLHESLNRFLLEQREMGKTVVLVVDEAQNLDPKVLEQLRLLSNLETETEKLIQMVLVGQPELDQILQRNDLRQLRQRMAVRYRLQPMDMDDTQRYVLHRVKIAGCRKTALFTAKALAQVYRFSRGTPRLINILCDRALLVAYSRDSQFVDKRDVRVAQKELQQQNSVQKRKLSPIIYGFFAVLLLSFVGSKILNAPESNSGQTDDKQTVTVNRQLQQILPLAVKSSSVVNDNVSAGRIKELQQTIAQLSVEQSGLQSVMTIAQCWQQPLLEKMPAIRSRKGLKDLLIGVGFDLVDIQGTAADLIKLDAPVILEINLPNVTGKRFFCVNRYRDGQFQTVPALTDSGWLDIAELNKVWFGRALMPYLNYQNIPLIDQPKASGNNVVALQQLLTRLKGEPSVTSGVYDEQTINIVTRFQARMQLAPDGRVGAHTLYWLYRQTGKDMPRLTTGDRL